MFWPSLNLTRISGEAKRRGGACRAHLEALLERYDRLLSAQGNLGLHRSRTRRSRRIRPKLQVQRRAQQKCDQTENFHENFQAILHILLDVNP